MKIIRSIQNRIYEVRGERVMLDSDLAALYETQTKSLNLAVKRNLKRFPTDFMFQLTSEQYEELSFQIETSKQNDSLRLQIDTSKTRGGRRYLPYVFTEQVLLCKPPPQTIICLNSLKTYIYLLLPLAFHPLS